MQDHIEANKKIMEGKVGYREDNRNLRKRHTRQINFLLEDDRVTKKTEILDIGCAEGLFLKRLGEKIDSKHLYGVDISEKAIDHLNTYYNNISGYVEDFHNLSFSNKSFDIITCNHTLEHSPNPEQVLSEIYRLLKKNGIVLIEVPIEGKEKEVGKGGGHYCSFTDDSFIELVNEYFKVLKSKNIILKNNNCIILKGEKCQDL